MTGQQAFPMMALLAAAGMALSLGLVLALTLTAAAASAADWGRRWRALAQVHGQVMVLGWAGLFVLGTAARLLPRFSSTPLRYPRALAAAAALITAALVLRGITQPLAEAAPMRCVLVGSGFVLLAGACCFAASVLATVRRPLRERKPFAAFFTAGALWLVVAAGLTVWALARAVAAGDLSVAEADNAPLLLVELYGFLLCFILGVSLRTIPPLYAWKTPPWLAWATFSALQGGLLIAVGARLAEATGHAGAWCEGGAGKLLLALAICGACGCMGVWRRASRLRDNARPIGLLLASGYGWLAATAVLLAYGAVHGLRAGAETPGDVDDAARHVLALGVVTTLIIGMAYLVGHMFAAERVARRPLAVRIWAYVTLLGGATLLRAAGGLLEARGVGAGRYTFMTAAGVLAFVAIALFAARLVHGLRHPYEPKLG